MFWYIIMHNNMFYCDALHLYKHGLSLLIRRTFSSLIKKSEKIFTSFLIVTYLYLPVQLPTSILWDSNRRGPALFLGHQ